MIVPEKRAIVLLLGGSGSRYGGTLPKQFSKLPAERFAQALLPTAEVPHDQTSGQLFELSVRQLLSLGAIGSVMLVIERDSLEKGLHREGIEHLRRDFPDTAFLVTHGGDHRHESFRLGVQFLHKEAPDVECILVHDANRPFIDESFAARIKQKMLEISVERPCFIPVIPLADSICESDGEIVTGYTSREKLFRIQTPQLLHVPSVLEAMQKTGANESYTDEGSFMMAAGQQVASFEGSATNTKITFPGDER